MNMPDCMYDYRYEMNRGREELNIYCRCCGVQISKTELMEYSGICEVCEFTKNKN